MSEPAQTCPDLTPWQLTNIDYWRFMSSIYEQLGGEAAIDAAVDLFYVKVLADERIKHFFEGVDMQKQARMQKGFLTFAFGGPNNYSGKGMAAAHKKLVLNGLDDSHYDAVVENLGNTLKDLGIADDLIVQAAQVAESVREAVLGRSV